MLSAGRRASLGLVVFATIVTGIAWGIVIPPFEGLDEIHYYRFALASEEGTPAGHPVFFSFTTPLLRLIGRSGVPFQIHNNPAYRPGFNRRGEVNFFLHDRTHNAPESHIRRLYLLRGAVLLMWLLTMVAAHEMAWLLSRDESLALLATGTCLFLPQISYFLAKVHTDALATLVSTLAYLALVARAVGTITRLQSVLALGALLAVTPWVDRQAYPLFLTVPIGLILLERRWPQRMIAVSVAFVPFAALGWLMLQKDIGGDLSAWLGPVVGYYRGPWWSTDTGNYLLFEALPKTIFGFFGWFNSSILLPAWQDAVAVDLAILGTCGLVYAGVARLGGILRRGMTDRELAALILAVGVFNTIMPILYTNVVIVRNPDGRYLLPAIVPMALLWLLGLRGLAHGIRVWPRLPIVAFAVVGVLGAVVWNSAAPAWIAAGVNAYHYGNQPHVLATLRDSALGLVFAPLVFAVGQMMPARPIASGFASIRRALTPRRVFVLAGILNLVLLMMFVRPLYRPLDAAGFARLIDEIAERQDFARAAAVTQIANEEFPGSAPLTRIVETGGVPPDAHPDLKTLARTVRTQGWPQPERLRFLIDREGPTEGAELLRMQLQPELKTDAAAAARLLQRPWVLSMDLDVNRQASIVGLSVREDPRGGCEATVFFRPAVPWTGRRLWVHTYPADAPDYDDLFIDPPAFSGWEPGELAWEVFHGMQRSGVLFTGVTIGGNLGGSIALAQMSNCLVTR